MTQRLKPIRNARNAIVACAMLGFGIGSLYATQEFSYPFSRANKKIMELRLAKNELERQIPDIYAAAKTEEQACYLQARNNLQLKKECSLKSETEIIALNEEKQGISDSIQALEREKKIELFSTGFNFAIAASVIALVIIDLFFSRKFKETHDRIMTRIFADLDRRQGEKS